MFQFGQLYKLFSLFLSSACWLKRKCGRIFFRLIVFWKMQWFHLNFWIRHGMITFEKSTALQNFTRRTVWGSKFITKIWRRKMFYNWSTVRTLLLLSLIDLEKWSFNSYSRGYHKYMNIWVPLIRDESLICRKRKGNKCDPHAVAITRGNAVVWHVPKNICDFFWKFLSLPNTSIRARVLGKRVNRGAGYGLEIPVCFVFQGHAKGAEWIKKIVEAEKKLQAHLEKFLKNVV